MKYLFKIFILFLLFTGYINAQNVTKWTINPFENKAFIENKGQYIEEEKKLGEDIYFGVLKDGMEIYFCKNKVVYKHTTVIPLTEEDREKLEGNIRKYEREINKKRKEYYVEMEWEGANAMTPDAFDKRSNYYTFSNPSDITGKTGIKADAYNRIVYHNVYSNIDVEFYFPNDTSGIKYNIKVNVGGDPLVFKMKYNGIKGIQINSKGDVEIKTPFGDIVDHAPVSFQNKKEIKSQFVLNKRTLGFSLNEYNKQQVLVIDPWITFPYFTATKRAYDINYDLDRNVFAYGGFPFQLVKINSQGIILWTYNLPLGFGTDIYGDFTLDRNTGYIYVCEGYNIKGVKIMKVRKDGVQVGYFAGYKDFAEAWRIEFDHCLQKIILGGGGNDYTYQAAVLETDLTQLNRFNILLKQDVSMLAIDNFGSSYFCFAHKDATIGGNQIIKCPNQSIIPVIFDKPNGYKIYERQISYYGIEARANGYNGIAVSNHYLYTCDGLTLKRWNMNTGALLDTIIISNDTTLSYGGLTVDACENIYVAKGNLILVYDTLFTRISSDKHSKYITDTIFDLKVDSANIVYVGGDGFASAIYFYAMKNCRCITTCGDSIKCYPKNIYLETVYENSFYIPNIFSPNGDPNNNVFKITAIGYDQFHLEIYNRWGNRMFVSDDAALHWNGKVNNTEAEAPDGTYYYVFSAVNTKTKEIKALKGFLTLVR